MDQWTRDVYILQASMSGQTAIGQSVAQIALSETFEVVATANSEGGGLKG